MPQTRPWLSVVTVVKDDPQGLHRTVQSLIGQSEQDFEFVVIDSSSDQNSTKRTLSQVPHAYVWSPANGIYPAMNLGIQHASGEYLYFLNAGDTVHTTDTLHLVRRDLLDQDPQWAFGQVRIIGVDGTSVITPAWNYQEHKASLFARGHFPAHQGTFVRRDVMEAIGGFNTTFRIAADYAAFLELAQRGDPLIMDTIVADFFEGGVSTSHWLSSFLEFHRARRELCKPKGMTALREYGFTVWQIARVGAYRTIRSRWVRT